MQIKNLSNVQHNFTIGAKDGEPVVKTIKPGETADINVKHDNANLLALIHTGSVQVVESAAKASKPAA